MIFKIERFAVPTVNGWTVTGVHAFLYFFFHGCHRLPQSVFRRQGPKLSCPLLLVTSYMMITMYRIQMVTTGCLKIYIFDSLLA